MSHSPQKQEFDRKRQLLNYDDDYDYPDILAQCINSDQVSASQLVQHYEAGEIPQLTKQPPKD